MKNKFEPLKGKIIDAGELTEEERKDIRGFFVFVKDLKSAVQGLLWDLNTALWLDGTQKVRLIDLVKEAFADVVDEEVD